MIKKWFLCALCAIGLTEALDLSIDPNNKELHKEKCRMCGKLKEGNYYIVRYRTKGEKDG